MDLDRRQLLLAAWLAACASRKAIIVMAKARDDGLFAAARRDDRGTYSAAMFSLEGDVRSVELPGRGHDIALRPGAANGSPLPAGPGNSASPCRRDGGAPIWFAAKEGRHFFGHGVFSADGKLLYTTENDYASAKGIIGIRDATDGYRQIGEFSAGGVEPHDIALMADGRTLVIANGGIQTHPDSGAEGAEHSGDAAVARLSRSCHRRHRRRAFARRPLCINSRSGILRSQGAIAWSSAANIAGLKRNIRRFSVSTGVARRHASPCSGRDAVVAEELYWFRHRGLRGRDHRRLLAQGRSHHLFGVRARGAISARSSLPTVAASRRRGTGRAFCSRAGRAGWSRPM